MEKLIDISSYPVANVLDLLLTDKSTKNNIIWATDTYDELGEGFSDKAQMSVDLLQRHPDLICPRIKKSQEAQEERTRKKAEVFTPAWICNRMNNYLDENWFGYENVFNTENSDHTWTVKVEKIVFPEGRDWQEYTDSRRLEITCGEAPFLVSRYDMADGTAIAPQNRIGILDRKLRVVNENTETEEEWLNWTYRAFQSVYGYEYQGDNLLIARINLLLSFAEYMEYRLHREPTLHELKKITTIICWNIWQMDGVNGCVPLLEQEASVRQASLFDLFRMGDTEDVVMETIPCRIFDWHEKSSLIFRDCRKGSAL